MAGLPHAELVHASEETLAAALPSLGPEGRDIDETFDRAGAAGGFTLLMIASVNGFLAVLEELLQRRRASVNLRDSGGCTALMYAVLRGHSQAVDRLISFAANVNQADLLGVAPLMCDALTRASDACDPQLEKLLSAAAQQRRAGGSTPLMWAARGRCIETVELLLVAGADPNRRDVEGLTALMYASICGRHEAASALLLMSGESGGARIDDRDFVGNTALIWAAKHGHDYTIVKLLQAGAEVDHANDAGHTALICAAMMGHEYVIDELLLEGGADVSLPSKQSGRTALWWASHSGHPAAVRRLLEELPRVGEVLLLVRQEGGGALTVRQTLRQAEFHGAEGPPEIVELLERAEESLAKEKESLAKGAQALAAKARLRPSPPLPRPSLAPSRPRRHTLLSSAP